LGGALSLTLGMSLAMLFEFLELMIDITFFYFRKPEKPNEELNKKEFNKTENQTLAETPSVNNIYSLHSAESNL
jgi:hypothetical protein